MSLLFFSIGHAFFSFSTTDWQASERMDKEKDRQMDKEKEMDKGEDVEK